MFKECETSEHKALEKEGLTVCPRCNVRLRTVIPYEEFQKKKRAKKYGPDETRIKKLRLKGYPDDFIFGTDEQ